MRTTVDIYKKCNKCNGMGQISAFLHVSNGACFRCNGEGKIKTGEKSIDKVKKIKPKYTIENVDIELNKIQKEAEEFDYSTL